jgi:hypothetical protein
MIRTKDQWIEAFERRTRKHFFSLHRSSSHTLDLECSGVWCNPIIKLGSRFGAIKFVLTASTVNLYTCAHLDAAVERVVSR